ncbi:MAG: protein translocase subunit SecD [Anaerolineae bacterium]|nr:protein translocase subunit SecD [Anaerolineae bacterium]MDQ7034412.1 protein translocase subunit SecD [Anaerolineae bacterium]
MNTHIRWLIVIVLLSVFCLWVVIPSDEDFELDFNDDGTPDLVFRAEQPLGLDLVGGLRVLLQATIPESEFETDDLIETANSVSRRINALGLSEATIQVQGGNRVLIELPGVTDREQAISTIQQTALLEFVDFGGLAGQTERYIGQRILTDVQLELQTLTEEQIATRLRSVTDEPFVTIITGSALKAASAQLDQQLGASWAIAFEIKPEFQQIFAEFTASRIGQPMAIVLDGEVLSAPTVQSELSSGGVITGQFTQEEAQTLALQLRSGALPIPLRVESAVEVGATLGRASVELSIKAGIIGVIVVLTFMLLFYRVPGIAADLALAVFILLNMALFKLIPVTLTLPAITGFLISIGTAVDGNILIFERIKEELRAGKEMQEALDTGFDRAWTSIRDSNLSTIIICGILFLFGQTPGASIVSGFAVTLALGLILNLFTAIIVTRTFLYIITGIMHDAIENHKWLLGA